MDRLRREPPWLVIAGLLAVVLAIALLVGLLRGDDEPALSTGTPEEIALPGNTTPLGRMALDALRPDVEADADELVARAQAGFANPLYRMVPGGAVASAARVTRLRPLIERVAERHDEDADTLEALVYLESAGRPEAMASNDVKGAVGLTQILAETGTSLLGMEIDVKRSQTLTRLINKGGEHEARRRKERAQVDPRFDAEQALEATARYLDFAREQLGDRDDLAVASYHMGVGNLQNALRDYGKGDVPYVELYFGTDPLSSPAATKRLMDLSDDSSSYLWRIGAAAKIMRQYREDRPALEREAELQTRKASSEDLLHPKETTPTFADAEALEQATADGELITLPRAALRANGLAIDRDMGELASRFDQPRTRYRALRPGALGGLLTIGAAVQALNGEQEPPTLLTVTSTVRDREYQARLGAENIQATQALSQHTTGWAMDFSRSYRTGAQAQLFQWTLTRLQALNLIAWVREPTAIHLTFSGEATERFAPILDAALRPRG